MAISKERLEELIEKEETIWAVYDEDRMERIKLVVRMMGVSVEEYNKIHNCEPMLYSQFCGIVRDICPISWLFETKSEAEEYAEFGNITKTERLPYVSYEEFSNGKVVEFVSNKLLYELKKCGEKIYISYRTYIDDSIWEVIFEQPLTKENYDKARRLCVKLFKGESV